MKHPNPGDTLWYVMRSRGKYRDRGDIIVPVKVEQLDLIYVVNNKTVWCYRFIDSSKDYVSYPTDQVDENGWSVYERKDMSFVKDLSPSNYYCYIDEPVGHHIQVCNFDNLYYTLEEAKRYASPSKKKHLKRRLKAWRWHPGDWSDKKIYVRKY